MKTTISAGVPALLSISEVAWLLGIDRSHVCRLIRVGSLPVVRRRSHVWVPAHVLVHLAGDTCQAVAL
jgi:excisionase family DNA binding protein